MSPRSSLVKSMSELAEQTSKLSLSTDKRSSRIQIDGSILEGGGQILRNASAYACILRKPVQVINVRGKRPRPGLKQQHLSGLKLVSKISGGLLEGGRVESREILLRPGNEEISEVQFTSDQPGAGSTTLVFQSALPVLLFAPHETKLFLRGGTDVQKSPSIDYIKHILLPFLKNHFGVDCALDIRKRGFSSYGGGEALITISPLTHKLKCISLRERGEITSFTGVIWTARARYENITNALEQSVRSALAKTHAKIPLNLTHCPLVSSPSCGIGMLLYAQTSLGHRIASTTMLEIPTRTQQSTLSKAEVKARERGAGVVRKLLQQLALGGAVDEYLADQIVIFMALATGGIDPPIAIERALDGIVHKKRKCEVLVGEISLHTETAMRIAEMMVPRIMFSTKKVEGVGIIMICESKAVPVVDGE